MLLETLRDLWRLLPFCRNRCRSQCTNWCTHCLDKRFIHRDWVALLWRVFLCLGISFRQLQCNKNHCISISPQVFFLYDLKFCFYNDFCPSPSSANFIEPSLGASLHFSTLSFDTELIKDETGTVTHSKEAEFLISNKQRRPQEPTASQLQQCLPFVCHSHIDHVNWCLFRQ